MLKAAATKTRACLTRERTARTQGAAAAGQAHFAAVMGNAIDSVLQESEAYRVYDCLTSDRDTLSGHSVSATHPCMNACLHWPLTLPQRLLFLQTRILGLLSIW